MTIYKSWCNIKSVNTCHVHRDCYQLTSRQLIFLSMNQSVFAVLGLSTRGFGSHSPKLNSSCCVEIFAAHHPAPTLLYWLTHASKRRPDASLIHTNTPQTRALGVNRKYFVILIKKKMMQKVRLLKGLFGMCQEIIEQIALGPKCWT